MLKVPILWIPFFSTSYFKSSPSWLRSLFRTNPDYFINLIPSGNMRWDDEKGDVVCEKGEDQCYRNLLQYCAIREYSFELAHEFVRCVQSYAWMAKALSLDEKMTFTKCVNALES